MPIYTARASTLLGDWWLDPVDDHAPAIGVAQIAVLYGDPDKAGPFVFRLKFPPGYKLAAHMHPTTMT